MATTKIDLEQLNLYLVELNNLLSKQVESQGDFNKKKTMSYDLEMCGDVTKQLSEIGKTLSLIDGSLNVLIKNTYSYLENRKKSFEKQEAKAMKNLK